MDISTGTQQPRPVASRAFAALACALLAAALALAAPASAHAATKATLAPGKTAKVTLYADSATQNAAALKPAGKKAAKGVWKSSKKKVATVTKGKVKAKKAGKTNITAKFGKKTYKAVVTVKNVSINKKSATLAPGATLDLKLVGDAVKKAKSSSTLVATVTPKGKVTAKKAGKATITLTSKKGKSYTCAVTVKANGVAVTGVSFSKATLNMKTGETLANAADVAPANATNKAVAYRSSAPAIATVDAKGVIEAVGVGSATITATTADGGKTATCKVEVAPGTVKATSAADVKKALSSGYDYEAVKLATSANSAELNIAADDPSLAAKLANTELIVDAPNASLDNYDKWKKVTVESISPNTYTEHSDNFICMRPANGRVVVANGARASIEAEKTVKNLAVENNGTIDSVVVSTTGTVDISGTSDQAAIPTKLDAAGTVKTSVVLDITATVKATVVLYPGSEGTTAAAESEAAAPVVEGIGTVTFTIKSNGASANMKTIVADYSDAVAEVAATATLKGTVTDEEGNPLSGAQVRLYAYTSDFSLAKFASLPIAKPATTTDANGAYAFAGVKAGNYIVVATLEGFAPSLMNVYLANVEGEAYSPQIVMVPGSSSGEGTISGQVIDSAESGNVGIAGITLRVREGLNNLTGEVLREVTTDSQGYYGITDPLPVGTYTIEAIDLRNKSDEFYISTHFNTTVYAGQQSTAGVGLTKAVAKGEMRFILHWNDEASGAPSDLDSHLRGPAGNDLFHVYYSNQEYSSGDTLMADLDRDDTDWEGPETTTIRHKSEGLYHYLIHDFTNGGSDSSSEMSKSGAYVEVYSGATRVQTFYVPANTPGTVWYVCTYNPKTNAITPVNTMSFESDSSAVGDEVVFGDLCIDSIAKNDFVKDYSIYGSRIVIETSEDADAAKASKILPHVVESGATAKVVYDDDEDDWTIELSGANMTRTYRVNFKTYYGDLKVTGFETNGVVTDYSIEEGTYDSSDRVELTVTAGDFSAYKSSVVPVIAQAGAKYALEEDEDGDVYLRISNAAGTLARSYRVYTTRDWGNLEVVGARSLDEGKVTDIDCYSSEIDVWTNIVTFNAADFERYVSLTYGSDVASHQVLDADDENTMRLVLKNAAGEERTYTIEVYRDWGNLCIEEATAGDSRVTDVDWWSTGMDVYSTAKLTPGNFDNLVNVTYGEDVASHQVVERDGTLYLVLKSAAGITREYRIWNYIDWGDLYLAGVSTQNEAVTYCDWENYETGSYISIELEGTDLTDAIVNSLEFEYGSDTISGSWSKNSAGDWVYTIVDSTNPDLTRDYTLTYERYDE